MTIDWDVLELVRDEPLKYIQLLCKDSEEMENLRTRAHGVAPVRNLKLRTRSAKTENPYNPEERMLYIWATTIPDNEKN